jgi:DNA-binding IclR family transcriptional regulator
MRITLATSRLRDLLATPPGQVAAAIAHLPADDRQLRLGDTNTLLMGTNLDAPTRADVQRLHDELLRAVARRVALSPGQWLAGIPAR